MSSKFRVLPAVLVLMFAGIAAADPPTNPPPAQAQAATAEARKLSDAFVAVAEKVSPSVVQIDVTTRDDNEERLSRMLGIGGDGNTPIHRGMGSGVVFTPDGGILTNNHVIDEALTINVRLKDGRYLPAKLVGRDPATDLAVVKIDAQGLPVAKLADSDASRVGEWVVAIGSPFGLGYSVTSGVLSAKGRGGIGQNAIEDYLQTDASINPGNSGGPLCNLDGHVVGINSMIVGRGTGIGFAVPSNIAKRVGEQILKTGHVQRAWIGVGYQDLTPELATAMKVPAGAGALINSISDGSPAQKAAIKAGDIIASVGGKPIKGGHELIREILAHDVGQTIQLEIVRDGKHYGTNVVLTARPEAAVAPVPVQQAVVPQSGMGLAVRDLAPQQAAQMGLPSKAVAVVTTVQPGSAADRAGIKSGDVVAEADGVADPNSAQIQQQAADGSLLLRMRRGDGAFYAVVRR